jgi:thymidylate synthase (FAD)
MQDEVTFPIDCIRVLDKGFVSLINHMGDDSLIARAARVSYGPGTRTVQDDTNLIRYLMRNKHTSPFEMCEFVFCLRLPIFVSNQLVRHRTASLNQMSGRYSVMPDMFYEPREEDITFQNPDNKQGGTNTQLKLSNIKNPNEFVDLDLMDVQSYDTPECPFSFSRYFTSEQEQTRWYYNRYIATGMRKELARINLPLSQYTEMYWKMDLHNLFHFLKLRLDHHAQYEIRVYAEAIYKIIKPLVPIACAAFEDYVLNSIALSAKDIEGLKNLMLDGAEGETTKAAETIFPNKRERSEFLNKVAKIRGTN